MTEKNKVKISLIVITFNNHQALKHILGSVKCQSLLPYEVVVTDDGSTEETRLLVESFQSKFPCKLKYVWQEHMGFRASKARNLGVINSEGDYLILIDGDRVLHPKFIEDFDKYKKEGFLLMGGRSFFSENYTKSIIEKDFNPVYFATRKKSNFEKNYINSFRLPCLFPFLPVIKKNRIDLVGGLIGFWKKDFNAINGYDEIYEGWGREDSDILVRMINHGVKIKKMKFLGITYHLWHPLNVITDRNKNNHLLDECFKVGRVRAIKGIDQYK